MSIEKYSHVIHMVTDVRGTVRPDISNVDVFKACFPAGTVSGAPKIRAIQIVEKNENIARGPYAGAVGYFSFTQDMDMCIAIRTMLIYKGRVFVQAGAGIVADSVPEREYRETKSKAYALLEAVRMGEKI
jgi:anthranilate synthase component 1